MTSRSSGGGIVNSMDVGAADEFVSLRYLDPLDHYVDHTDGVTLEQLESHVRTSGQLGRFGLVVIDPFHTYESSERAYRLALRLAEPGALVISHDCAPPYDFIAPEPTEQTGWSGPTFLAFRDVCETLELPWCTVDDDMGVGITARTAQLDPARLEHTLASAPSPADLEARRARYAADPNAYMRLVPTELADLAVATLAAGESLSAVLERADSLTSPTRSLVTALDREFWLWTSRTRRLLAAWRRARAARERRPAR